MAIKTASELLDEWGLERYTSAFATLCAWYLDYGIPKEVGDMMALHKKSNDAFDVFAARIYHAIIHVEVNDGND